MLDLEHFGGCLRLQRILLAVDQLRQLVAVFQQLVRGRRRTAIHALQQLVEALPLQRYALGVQARFTELAHLRPHRFAVTLLTHRDP